MIPHGNSVGGSFTLPQRMPQLAHQYPHPHPHPPRRTAIWAPMRLECAKRSFQQANERSFCVPAGPEWCGVVRLPCAA